MKRGIWILTTLILMIAAAGAAWWFARYAPVTAPVTPPPAAVDGVVQDESGKRVLYWYDPMVPDQKFDKPGKSPFMDMALVPKYAVSGMGEEVGGVAISSRAVQNLGIRTGPVVMASFGEALQTVGRIEADERRMAIVLTRVPGFVERLYLRAEGDPVKQGQKVAEVYAPELLAAQNEYLALLDYQGRAIAAGLVEAARKRLELLGMNNREIAALTERRQPLARFGVYAPTSGIVSRLEVREGGQVGPGGSLMQITDLSRVWLIAEVPEQSISQIRAGSRATLTLPGLPDAMFEGKVSYLYPTLDILTRTLPVRVELGNAKGSLRPGMYGEVSFAGKKREVLAVPAESVIHTGTRQVVILKTEGGFRPAEVRTGQRQGEQVEILSGLSAGEEVVLSGQFLIDSEASLSGVLARLAALPEQAGKVPSADIKTPAPSQPLPGGPAARDEHAGHVPPAEHGPHAGHAMPEQASPDTKMPHGTGKVVAVNADAGSLKLSHDPIPALGWPAMTMGFEVMDKRQLAPLKPGDMVEFDLMHDEEADSYHIHRIGKQENAR